MSFDGKQAEYTSAHLGNALRATAWKARNQLYDESTKSIDPIRNHLLALIAGADDELLSLHAR